MSDMQPTIQSGQRLSAVWIIPIVALLVGIGMVVRTYMTQGPVIEIEFTTAAGLEPGLTKVKLLDVDVGVLESLAVTGTMDSVIATVKLFERKRPLLREDARYWVVRPRISAAGISGLETLMVGSHIGVAPGIKPRERSRFIGLENPPLTPADAPGVRLTLRSERAGSIKVGNPILHNGFAVGRVEAMRFDADLRQARYDIFIDAPFHQLIDSATRFWNISGISLQASTEGVKLQAGSLDTILLGGVTFDTPPGLPPGTAVTSGREYQLFDSFEQILERPYLHGLHYVVMFEQSLRGLLPGAPVEYLGIQIGRVERILLKEFTDTTLAGGQAAIPVLIYIEPGRLELPDNQQSIEKFQQLIAQGAQTKGLRASLATGNLLTGKQLIAIDYFADQPPTPEPELARFGEHAVIPTITAGVAGIERQVATFLEKLNQLPITATLEEANSVLVRAEVTLASLNSLLAGDQSQALPAELAATLAELRHFLAEAAPDPRMSDGLSASVNELNSALERVNLLMRTLSINPNSILFPSTTASDPIPQARP